MFSCFYNTLSNISWRKERDSNPRTDCSVTRVPGVPVQPLLHPSLLIIIPQLYCPLWLHLLTFILYNKSKMKETIPPRIRLVNVTKKFGFGDAEIRALDNVDLTVKKGWTIRPALRGRILSGRCRCRQSQLTTTRQNSFQTHRFCLPEFQSYSSPDCN